MEGGDESINMQTSPKLCVGQHHGTDLKLLTDAVREGQVDLCVAAKPTNRAGNFLTAARERSSA